MAASRHPPCAVLGFSAAPLAYIIHHLVGDDGEIIACVRTSFIDNSMIQAKKGCDLKLAIESAVLGSRGNTIPLIKIKAGNQTNDCHSNNIMVSSSQSNALVAAIVNAFALLTTMLAAVALHTRNSVNFWVQKCTRLAVGMVPRLKIVSYDHKFIINNYLRQGFNSILLSHAPAPP